MWIFRWLGSWLWWWVDKPPTGGDDFVSLSADLDGDSPMSADMSDGPTPVEPIRSDQIRPVDNVRAPEAPPAEDDRCVEPEALDLPEPVIITVDCGAATPDPPPPPPPPDFRSLVVREEGPIRQFRPIGRTDDISNWTLGQFSLPGGLAMGERWRGQTSQYIHTPGSGDHGGQLVGITYYGNPFGQNISIAGRLIWIEIAMGTYNGPHSPSPYIRQAHLPDNHVFIKCVGTWLSLSPLVITSWVPFRAYTCASNLISGWGPESQLGVRVVNPFGALYPSPPSNVWSGSTVKLTFNEI